MEWDKNKNIEIINLTCYINHDDFDGNGYIEDYIQGSITNIKYK